MEYTEVAADASTNNYCKTFDSGGISSSEVCDLPDETVVVPDLESFLCINQVDPWHELSVLTGDCVLLIEFSEIEGPKPCLTIPDTLSHISCGHFDPNELAVRLMTADYQAANRPGSVLAVAKDTQLLLTNEEQGVHCYAQYFTLLDLEARGYVRPFCIAYVSPNEQKVIHLFDLLKMDLMTLLRPVKSCNVRQFLKELSSAAEVLESLENRAVSSYYELYYDRSSGDELPNHVKTHPNAVKPEFLHFKYSRLRRELETAHAAISGRTKSPESPNICNVSHIATVDTWVNRLVHHRGADQSAAGGDTHRVMKELKLLCPCAYDSLIQGLLVVLKSYTQFNPHIDWIFACGFDEKPVLQFGDSSLLFLPRNNSSSLHMSWRKKPKADTSATSITSFGSGLDRKSLIAVIPYLPQIMFPLLIGQFFMIYGGELRKPFLLGLVDTLRYFIPRAVGDDSTEIAPYLPWHEGRIEASFYADLKLVGQFAPNGSTIEKYVADNIRPFLALLDLNADTFYGSRYKGALLERLASKEKSSLYRNDHQLAAFVMSILAELCSFAYVLYFTVYCDHETYRRNARYLKQFADALGLENGDLKIVRYFVEQIKISQGSETQLGGFHENFFLEHSVSKPVKLH